MRVSLFPFPFGFTKILTISSPDSAACVFANKCGEVHKSVQSFKDTLLFHETLSCVVNLKIKMEG